MLFNMSQAEVKISAFMISKNKYLLDDLAIQNVIKKKIFNFDI